MPGRDLFNKMTINKNFISASLSFSQQKSKQKSSNYPKEEYIFQSVKRSAQKVQQIAHQKYKQALKHMEKFKKLQQEVNQRKRMQNQLIDSQCTFKPKINHNKKYSNLTSKFMTISFTQRYVKKSIANPEKKGQNQPNGKEQLQYQKKYNLGERMINSCKNREIKILNKTIGVDVKKSLQKSKSISCHNAKNSQKRNFVELSGYGQKRKLDKNVRILYTEASSLLNLDKSQKLTQIQTQRKKSESKLKKISWKMINHCKKADELTKKNKKQLQTKTKQKKS